MSRLLNLLENRLQKTSVRVLTVTFLVLILFAITKPTQQSNTIFYGQSVVDYSRDHTRLHDYYEAGHLLWLPIGYFFKNTFAGFFNTILPGEDFLQALAVFTAVAMLATWLGALLLSDLLSRFCKSALLGTALTFAWLCWNPIVNYGQAGTSYVPGLTCLLLSMLCLVRTVEDPRRAKFEILVSGVALALAALFWLTYILAAPAMALFLLFWRKKEESSWRIHLQERLPSVVGLTAATVLTLVIGWGWVWQGMGLKSMSQFTYWFFAPSGYTTPPRSFVPLATGLPRAFLDLGSDGLIFKRMVLRDPYAATTWIHVAAIGLTKLGLPLLFMAVVAILALSRGTRLLLLFLLTVMIPLVIFGVFFYDATSPERYMPAFPLFIMTVGLIFTATWNSPALWKRGLARFMAAFLAFVVLHNLYECSRWRVRADHDLQARRAEGLRKRNLGSSSVVFVLFSRDPLSTLYGSDPFHQVNRPQRLPLRDLFTGWGLAYTYHWKEDFAQTANSKRAQCGEIWVASRLFADRPDPSWKWVEGENLNVPWKAIPEFFRQWDWSESVGGQDGFAQLADTARNQALIQKYAGEPVKSCPAQVAAGGTTPAQ